MNTIFNINNRASNGSNDLLATGPIARVPSGSACRILSFFTRGGLAMLLHAGCASSPVVADAAAQEVITAEMTSAEADGHRRWFVETIERDDRFRGRFSLPDVTVAASGNASQACVLAYGQTRIDHKVWLCATAPHETRC